jgi:chemotaxis regulatin CheY-phosphate phosphatase CheZ
MPQNNVTLPVAQDLQPLHDRINSLETMVREGMQNASEQISDIRERLASAEQKIEQLAMHNPASTEALRLAQEAHEIVNSVKSDLRKLQKEAGAVPARALQEVTPPAAPPDQPPPSDLTPAAHASPRKWWEHIF